MLTWQKGMTAKDVRNAAEMTTETAQDGFMCWLGLTKPPHLVISLEMTHDMTYEKAGSVYGSAEKAKDIGYEKASESKDFAYKKAGKPKDIAYEKAQMQKPLRRTVTGIVV
ncbi:hypothetical protein Bca52824_031672 [Brassica carinata]|uniref:Uncharacterized protein n=1 Tax=Brassica carinata TaxID=52824 RepID=A0A8X7V7Y1_BRACI|nr:hypothetical protein Bca52824_031672 [Brassica carinata]